MEYEEIHENVAGPGFENEELDVIFEGCECEAECTAASSCSCLMYKVDNYGQEKRLENTSLPILECHANCSCNEWINPCQNRVIRTTNSLDLQVIDFKGKGKGVLTKRMIPKATFVAEYAGELLGKEEVERRAAHYKGDNYTLTVKEHFGDRISTTFIDPRLKGKISRFINHSCEPNLDIFIVRTGCMAPSIGLFASRDISPNEELSYNYGESKTPSGILCLCGSKVCRGQLPASQSASD
ncbi:unnamed protein product, partial [Mesorhabditis belari]|uniref:Histone-lysine N-methyltransferase set-23 n=1 Tax=Mesorhabditis belari TaxID=2138241 RepID=A0AAF3EBE9_9BILA